MKRIITFILLFSASMIVLSCGADKTKKATNIDKKAEFYTVNEIFEKGDELSEKSVNVKGTIEHVCKHTWKRFKIIDSDEKHELRIELGDDFETVNNSIFGRTAYVVGVLIPEKMGASEVKEWELKMKQNHKGEEDTEHYKEEIGKIKAIYAKIMSGDIPYFMNYYIQADNYEIE
jgi:hypothetical protein